MKKTELDTLDKLLFKTLLYLFEQWYNTDVGIVACCLKDNDKIVFATSSRNQSNWLHAERNAYTKFQSAYGEPSDNAVFIITLSPCLKSLKYRGEESCSDLIKKTGVKNVHFGILDTFHASSISAYSEFGLSASLTENSSIKTMCQKLMDMFLTYNSRINSELLLIKKELGDLFFSPVLLDRKNQEVGTEITSIKCRT